MLIMLFLMSLLGLIYLSLSDSVFLNHMVEDLQALIAVRVVFGDFFLFFIVNQ